VALSLQNLTKDADIIVVGEVVDVQVTGPGRIVTTDGESYPAELTAATIRVDQVLKGSDASPSIHIEYLHNVNWEVGPLTDGLVPKTYRMVFLKRSSGKYEFADPAYASMPVPREAVSGVPHPPGNALRTGCLVTGPPLLSLRSDPIRGGQHLPRSVGSVGATTPHISQEC
jgi:hypothetical protein